MKIDYLSDLHIDFYLFHGKVLKDEDIRKIYEPIVLNKNLEVGDVLIVAGDIGHYNYQNIRVLKFLKEHYYKYIICVLGNHDYYLMNRIDEDDYDMDSFNRVNEMRSLINKEENMYCLNGESIEINGIIFAGCDSWYNNGYLKRQYPNKNITFKSTNQMWHNCMNDAQRIYGIKNYDDIWNIEKSKLEAVYNQCDVMITHINPSCKDEHINIKYQNNPSNVFFSFEGEEYLKNGNMKYWVFGHTHEELEYEDHGVKCLCNPFGYPGESGNGQWVEIRSFEIEPSKEKVKNG